MDYQKHYDLLMHKAKERGWMKKSAPFYVERHHITPRCLGGTNKKDNIVCLLYREHRTAHLLLCKIYPNNYKLLSAAKRMYSSGKYHNGNRDNKGAPEWARIKHAEEASKFFLGKKKGPFSAEHIRNLSKSHIGHKDSGETKRKKSESNKNRTVKESTREKCRLNRSKQINGGDKKVSIMGIEYPSIGKAEVATDISRFNLWRRLNLPKYTDYFYLKT